MTATGSATFGVFGTTAVLLVTEPAALSRARSMAEADLAAVDLACSRFRPDSELSRLNASHGELARVSDLLAELIAVALRAAELTAGDVDPTCGRALAATGYDRDFGELSAGADAVPRGADDRAAHHDREPSGIAGPAVAGWRSIVLDRGQNVVRLSAGAQLDLGCTAKAWAADHCADRIAAALGCGVLVSLGGDIAVAGPAPSDGWPVRATDDHGAGPDAPGQTVTIRSGGLATSSTTVRAWVASGRAMHHIIDPSTGQPARSCWRTVSVAAGSCADANTASTAAIIRGESAVSWLNTAGLPARLTATDGAVTTTAGWPDAPANDGHRTGEVPIVDRP